MLCAQCSNELLRDRSLQQAAGRMRVRVDEPGQQHVRAAARCVSLGGKTLFGLRRRQQRRAMRP